MSSASPRFIDALGGQLPALERCLIRYRALQATLAIFHAEELKRDIISAAETHRNFRTTVHGQSGRDQGTDQPKNRMKRAFQQLIDDGLLSTSEKKEMLHLIGHRNAFAHQLHELSADLSPDSFARSHVEFMTNRPEHDYEIVEKLRAARRLLDDRVVENHYVTSIRFNDVLFSAVDRALTADLRALKRRIVALIKKRKAAIKSLNAELSLEGTELTGELHPRHPLNQYANGRLTGRGEEICYRLFDSGKSHHATAQLMGLTIISIRSRYKKWERLGGRERTRVELASLSAPQIGRRYED